MQRSKHNAKRDDWPPSFWISSSIQLHNSVHRPAAHGRDVENCLYLVMEIAENELDEESWRSGAKYNKIYFTDFYVVDCRPKALERNWPTSFLTQIMSLVVDQKLRGFEAFVCRCLYIETIYWLPITTICILTYNCWTSTYCWYVTKLSVIGASMILGLIFSAYKWPHSHILPKWPYWRYLEVNRIVTRMLIHTRN